MQESKADKKVDAAEVTRSPVGSSKVSSKAKKVKSDTFPRAWKKQGNKPKRPLSAYNLFFRDERLKMLQSRNSTTGGVSPNSRRNGLGFDTLARTVADKWKNLDTESRSQYDIGAEAEKKKYYLALAAWKRAQHGDNTTVVATAAPVAVSSYHVQHSGSANTSNAHFPYIHGHALLPPPAPPLPRRMDYHRSQQMEDHHFALSPHPISFAAGNGNIAYSNGNTVESSNGHHVPWDNESNFRHPEPLPVHHGSQSSSGENEEFVEFISSVDFSRVMAPSTHRGMPNKNR